jgi:tRNA pseudouridine38-40 synthase
MEEDINMEDDINTEIQSKETQDQTEMWKRYFMHISYDGTDFHGWQRQLNSHSVQEEVEMALRKLLRQTRVVSVGCGRTDAGVHARQFFLHFNAEKPIEDLDGFFFRLNMMLPKNIGIYKVWQVDNLAHARFDAIERSYEYHLHQIRNPFIERYSTFFPWELDIEKMNEAAQLLLNYSDFAAFAKTGGGSRTTICDLRRAEWKSYEERMVFYITADRFLRNMVRAIVGTLLDVGRNRISNQEFIDIIEGKSRSSASDSAAGRGLHLTQIIYPSFTADDLGNQKPTLRK